MLNFYKIGENLTVSPLVLALHRLEKSSRIWKEDTYLRDYPQGPFASCESVILRFPPRSVHETEEALKKHLETFDPNECIDQPVFKQLPEARPLIFALMTFAQGERLGRVLINKINPGGVIYPHADTDAHAAYYDRFHIVLKSSPGVVFRCGTESINMETGSAFWFDNSKEHEVINNSAEERISMVVDIRTSK